MVHEGLRVLNPKPSLPWPEWWAAVGRWRQIKKVQSCMQFGLKPLISRQPHTQSRQTLNP